MSALRKHLSDLNLSWWPPIPGVQLTHAANPPPRCHHYMRSHSDFQLSRLPQHPHLSTHQRARPIQLLVSLVPAATLHGRQRGMRAADPSHPQHVLGFKRARPEVGSVCVRAHVCACPQASISVTLPAAASCPTWLWGALSPWEKHLSGIMLCASQHKS